MFARRTLMYGGCTAADADPIQSDGRITQALSDLGKKWNWGNYLTRRDRIFALNGLKAGALHHGTYQSELLAARLVAAYMDSVVIIQVNIPSGPHVIAAWIKDETRLQLFDPNGGLFEETSADAYSNLLIAHFTQEQRAPTSTCTRSRKSEDRGRQGPEGQEFEEAEWTRDAIRRANRSSPARTAGYCFNTTTVSCPCSTEPAGPPTTAPAPIAPLTMAAATPKVWFPAGSVSE